MNRDYTDYPERNSEHIVQNEHNEYQDKFFHDIDLAFLLDAIKNIEAEGYTLKIVNGKLQLLDHEETVVSEVDISSGSQGPVGPTPNISMNASVDSDVGTPSVAITKTGTPENPTFSLQFHNLKGQKGDPGQSIVGPPGESGQDGETPNVSATASVDSNTGTPSVTVTKTGTTENPNFNFAFSNIKGATGPASTVPGPAGEPGTPFQVKAQYDTWADFIAAHPTGQVGDAYQVGDNDDYYTKSEVDDIIGDIRQVPAISSGDAGKVLSVNSAETGTEWVTPSGGGGDAVIPVFWSNTWMNLEEIWDALGQKKLFDRNTDTSFQFVAGTNYRLKSVLTNIPTNIVFNEAFSGTYNCMAVPRPETIVVHQGVQLTMTQAILIPLYLNIDRLWPMSKHMSGTIDNLEGYIEVYKQSYQQLDTLLNDYLYFRARVSYTPSETWTWDVSSDMGGNLGFTTKTTQPYYSQLIKE